MSREAAIGAALAYFDGGGFEEDLARRVAIRSESQNPEAGPEMERYLQGDPPKPSRARSPRSAVFTRARASPT